MQLAIPQNLQNRPLTWQSKRSVTPPWPGIESPKSLILKLRIARQGRGQTRQPLGSGKEAINWSL